MPPLPTSADLLADLFRRSADLSPAARHTVFVEESPGGPAYRVWIGNGYYTIDHDRVADALSTTDIGNAGPFTPAPHPALLAWPVLRRLALKAVGSEDRLSQRFLPVLKAAYPGQFEPNPGAVHLTDEMKTVLALACLGIVEDFIAAVTDLVEDHPPWLEGEGVGTGPA